MFRRFLEGTDVIAGYICGCGCSYTFIVIAVKTSNLTILKWIDLPQDRYQCRALVNTLLNLQVA
jgi:hypothetical protein